MLTTTTTLARRRNGIAIAAGLLNVLIGLTVLAGYVVHEPGLVRLIPGSAPMRLTTAIAVLACGAAVLLLFAGFARCSAALGAVCGVIGLSQVAEVVTGTHIAGFDPVAFVGGAPPRAGALIALLELLAATALVLMSGVVRLKWRLAIVGAIGSVIHSIGVVAAVSYAAGVSSAFTEGRYSQLSIHTSIALAALGAALIRFAWRDSVTDRTGAPSWVPVLFGAGALATAFCLYGAVIADEDSDFEHQVTFEAEGLRQFLQAGIDNRIQPLIRMARRMATAPDTKPELKKDDWDSDAQAILTRGGYQAIQWIDAAGRSVWTTPPGAGDNTPDGNAAFEARRQSVFQTARDRREYAISLPVDLVTGGRGMIVAVPVFTHAGLAGYVSGIFRYQLFFQNLLSANPSPRFSLAIRHAGERLFSQGIATAAARLSRAMDLSVGGDTWKLDVAPTEALVLQSRSPVAGALLVAGGFVAAFLTLLVFVLHNARGAVATAGGVAGPVAMLAASVGAAPIVSYGNDGAPLCWNDPAQQLFTGAPPPIPPSELSFRAIHSSILRVGAEPQSLEAMSVLLESCAQPALLFGPDGKFMSANRAAVQMLGWSDAQWSGKALVPAAPAGGEGLTVRTVVLLQGRWSSPAKSVVAAAG